LPTTLESSILADDGNEVSVGGVPTAPYKLDVVGSVRATELVDRANSSFYVLPSGSSVLETASMSGLVTVSGTEATGGGLDVSGTFLNQVTGFITFTNDVGTTCTNGTCTGLDGTATAGLSTSFQLLRDASGNNADLTIAANRAGNGLVSLQVSGTTNQVLAFQLVDATSGTVIGTNWAYPMVTLGSTYSAAIQYPFSAHITAMVAVTSGSSTFTVNWRCAAIGCAAKIYAKSSASTDQVNLSFAQIKG